MPYAGTSEYLALLANNQKYNVGQLLIKQPSDTTFGLCSVVKMRQVQTISRKGS
jgi:hypothetical protein